MIEIKNKRYQDMLNNPDNYPEIKDQDIVLVEVHPYKEMIMIGYDDEKQSYYLVTEDDETTQDNYCEKSNLKKKFDELLIWCLGVI